MKILLWSLYLINLEAQLFSGEYCEIFQIIYSEEHLQKTASEVSGEIAFASISLFYVKIWRDTQNSTMKSCRANH